MDANTVDYYRTREARERDLAASAHSKAIAAIHREMAEQYRHLIDRAATAPRC